MGAETAAAFLVGLLAMGVLLAPILWPGPDTGQGSDLLIEPELEDTPRGRALLALKEIDFDRATGKLSEADYLELKARYSARALELLESDPGKACAYCGSLLVPDSRFCEMCGTCVASNPASPTGTT